MFSDVIVAGFWDSDLTQCEHVLVKTFKIISKCYECKQLKWPWTKSVGCIKCMKVWHRRCRPAAVTTTAAWVNVEETVQVIGNCCSSRPGVGCGCRKIFEQPLDTSCRKTTAVTWTSAVVAPELHSGQMRLPAVPSDLWSAAAAAAFGHPVEVSKSEHVRGAARVISLDSWPAFGHPIKWPRSKTAGMCLERFISLQSWPVPVRPIKWPKKFLDTGGLKTMRCNEKYIKAEKAQDHSARSKTVAVNACSYLQPMRPTTAVKN